MNTEPAESKTSVQRCVMPPLSSDETLVSALRVLSVEIESADGVANAALFEAATRMEQLLNEVWRLRNALTVIAGHSVCCDARHCADRVLSGGAATIEA